MNPDQKDNYWQDEPTETVEADTPHDEASDRSPTPDGAAPNNERDAHDADEEVVNWTAAEYIHIQKGTLWYVIFSLITLLLIAIDVILLHTYTLSVLVAVMAVALILYSRQPPADIHYTLSGKQGLYIGEQLYTFTRFKAFGVIQDGEHHFIKFIPTKRLSPGLSVYFPTEAGEAIVDILGTRLPMENLKLDIVDVITRSIHL